MPPTRTSAAKATPRARPRRQEAAPRLNPAMACDTAFRVIARRYLGDLVASQKGTREGDPSSLHQMRIALTRLRTAILFFSPMVADSQRSEVRDQLKWLNGHLGAVRDLDVAIERIDTTSPLYRSWQKKRADSRRLLARALQSVRYRHLIEDTSDWIENGPWSIKRGKQATAERGMSIAAYGADRLARWQRKLLRKSRKLAEMDPAQRHRLRLLNKKLSYSVEALDELFADKRFSGPKISLKHLRKAQRCLGQLNDDARGHALATAMQRDGADPHLQFLSAKREKQLLRATAAAYRKLEALS